MARGHRLSVARLALDLPSVLGTGIAAAGIGEWMGLGPYAVNTLPGIATLWIVNVGTSYQSLARVGNDGVANATLANMAANTIKGNNTGATGDPLDLTTAQVAAMLPAVVGDAGAGGTKGLVPSPAAGDSAKFLKGDGTWGAVSAVPSGAVMPYAGASAPSGWLLADGSAVSRTTFAALLCGDR